jgi:glutathione S-transferase
VEETIMKLYFSPGACSLSPHIVLREAGLPFEVEQVNLGSHQTKSGVDFRTINPKGYVPALKLDDGEVLTEGPAIVQLIADQVPNKQLVPPAGTRERYHMQEWLNFISTELHKSFGPLFNSKTPDEYKQMVRENISGRFDLVAKHFEDGRKYITGDTFTVADAYLFTVLRWTKVVHIDTSKWPLLDAFLERVAARPAVQAALSAEGLIKASA